jgi:hypothetical protein
MATTQLEESLEFVHSAARARHLRPPALPRFAWPAFQPAAASPSSVTRFFGAEAVTTIQTRSMDCGGILALSHYNDDVAMVRRARNGWQDGNEISVVKTQDGTKRVEIHYHGGWEDGQTRVIVLRASGALKDYRTSADGQEMFNVEFTRAADDTLHSRYHHRLYHEAGRSDEWVNETVRPDGSVTHDRQPNLVPALRADELADILTGVRPIR